MIHITSPAPVLYVLVPPRHVGRLFALIALVIGGAALLAGLPSTPAAASESADPMCSQALALLNAERAAAGLPAIEETPEIIAVAVERAREMAATGAFSHSSPSGADAHTLLVSQGVSFQKMGENIAQSNDTPAAVVSTVHAMLMASAPHRANMLDPTYGHVGIGIAQAGDTFYFAIVFTADD